jgi:hypothetical protein
MTVKNLCSGQNYDLVLFGSKKNDAIREFPQFATCGFPFDFQGFPDFNFDIQCIRKF